METKERGRWDGGQGLFLGGGGGSKGNAGVSPPPFVLFGLSHVVEIFFFSFDTAEVCLDTRLLGESRDERCQRRCFGI